MADYDNRYYSGRHDPYYSRGQSSSRYSNVNRGGYPYSYDPRYSNYTANPTLPKRSSVHPSRSDSRNNPQWPPKPSVEDEVDALAKEVRSSVSLDGGGNVETPARGSVDQLPIIEEIERPRQYYSDDRRFVLVSDPSKHSDSTPAVPSSGRYSRRRSAAERGNMPQLNTQVDEPPVFTGRTPTPYAYSKPAKESITPSPGDYYLSPEPMNPAGSSTPRSMRPKDSRDTRKNQNTRPSKSPHRRYDSTAQPSGSPKNYVFEDSDVEAEDATRLRTDRRPARYSFVKSDAQKGDLRTDLRNVKIDNEAPRPPPQYSPKSSHDSAYGGSTGSSKNSSPPTQSPRASASSVNNGYSKPKPIRVPTFDKSHSQTSTTYPNSRPASRESSPRPQDRRPRVPSPHPSTGPSLRGGSNAPPQYASSKYSTNRVDGYASRPSARGTPQPATPSSQSTVPEASLNEPSRHTTYPPAMHDRSRPPSRFVRHDTAPLPVPPRIDVQSPSPARQPYTASPPPYPTGPSPHPTGPLPYPDEGSPGSTWMPSETQFQVSSPYTTPSPSSPFQRQPYSGSPQIPSPVPHDPASYYRTSTSNTYPGSPQIPSPVVGSSHDSASFYRTSTSNTYADSPQIPSPVVSSPHDSASFYRTSTSNTYSKVEDVPRSTRVRSDSLRSQKSQTSNDSRRSERPKQLSVDKPLPSCPRSEPSDKYDDWYTLENCPDFDVCPSCYKATFADTQFSAFFKQTRMHEVPVARVCDFSSPWVRLAWLLTIKQKRKKLDLLYSLSIIADTETICPGERELAGPWYGLPDPRDGVPIENFTVCTCDLRQIEALFPSLRGCLVRVPPDSRNPNKTHKCSLRVSSRRFPKYLDVLVDIDNTALKWNRAPDMEPILRLAREYAFKMECARDKTSIRKPWHFIPQLPELTVCEECYDDVVWPAIKAGSRIACMFNRTLQLVPDEASQGSACCLYSPRMRAVWERAVGEEDFGFLKRKVVERKRVENRIAMTKAGMVKMLEDRGQGGWDDEKLKRGLRDVEGEWRKWE